MAYVNSTRVASNGLVERLMAAVAALRTNLGKRALYARTVRELQLLTDRELADLGINRASIHSVASEAAYGK